MTRVPRYFPNCGQQGCDLCFANAVEVSLDTSIAATSPTGVSVAPGCSLEEAGLAPPEMIEHIIYRRASDG